MTFLLPALWLHYFITHTPNGMRAYHGFAKQSKL